MTLPIHPLKVIQVDKLAPQIIRLLLKPEQPIAYSAGQYIMLGFHSGDLKPFSIASAPREDGLIECHIRNQEESDWMQALFAVTPGDALVMQDPKDQMQLQAAHQPIIFIAGGTGFAPMKALLDALFRQEVAVPVYFYWGARSVADLYLHDVMIGLSLTHLNLQYIPVISESDANWQGLTGLVHEVALQQHPDLQHKTVYMCGSWPMIQQAKLDLLAAGINPQHLVI